MAKVTPAETPTPEITVEKPAPPPAAFPITLLQFLAKFPERDFAITTTFRKAMEGAGMTSGKKQDSEWQHLFDLFKKKPVNIPWATWATKGGK